MMKLTDEELADFSYNLILHAGNARTAGDMAIQAAKKGDFEQAAAQMKTARAELDIAHQVQTELLTANASEGGTVRPDFLLVHAANHYEATDAYLMLCDELIAIHGQLARLAQH